MTPSESDGTDWLTFVTAFTARGVRNATVEHAQRSPSFVIAIDQLRRAPGAGVPPGDRDAISDAHHVTVHRHGAWFRIGRNEPVSLLHRPLLGRVLVMLAEHHISGADAAPAEISGRMLFATAWQGQIAADLSARKRVRSAIWALRRQGLRDIIVTRGDSYGIPTTFTVTWSDDPLR
ncbi:MAG: hypothetical protein AB7P03_18955 [Kofleriaceae bacterium]